MRHANKLAFVFLLAVTTVHARAYAQPAAPATVDTTSARADDLAHKGNDLALKGKWTEAEALFQQAWALKQSYDIGGNLGLAELALGKHRDAAEHLAFALAHFPANGKTEHRDLLREKLAEAREHVGALHIRVNVDGAEVTMNGRPLGTAPIVDEVFADPGMVTLVARRDGYVAAQQTIPAAKGETREVSLTLQPIAGKTERRSVVPGAVLGGVAGAALVTGIGLLVGGRSKQSSVKTVHDAILSAGHSCVTGAGNYDPRCADLQSTTTTGNTLQRAGVGLMVGAGAAAVGSLIYFVLPPSSSGTSTTGTLHITPALSPASAGLSFSGTF